MKKLLMIGFLIFCGFTLLVGCGPSEEKDREVAKTAPSLTPEAEIPEIDKVLTIGTGEINDVYHPTGKAIAEIVNKKRDQYGFHCKVVSTGGSVSNVNAVVSGDLQLGMVQSDLQYQAINGLTQWRGKGSQENLRAMFSIHSEAVTLVAAVDAGIEKMAELRGKRVNIGNPASGHRRNAIDALTAVGINYKTDLTTESFTAAQASGLLQEGKLDAFFYTGGHPNDIVKEAVSDTRKVRLIPIVGPGIDTLIQNYPYYTKEKIPVSFYPGAANKEDVETFGVKATLVTSVKVPEDVVYNITREVFENFDNFKTLHPAYAMLTKEGMLQGLSAPVHPGAFKYFKESALK
ncbi:MAG: TAXI family TRAP transporter solute-binding subunit [Desulfobacterales bacterium]|jgi:hypothetical protein